MSKVTLIRVLGVYSITAVLGGASDARAASPKTIAKEAWITSLKGSFPAALCQNDYFAKCFAVDNAACKAAADSAFLQCSTELRDKIPEQVASLDAQVLGGRIGGCVGQKVELSLAHDRVKGEVCESYERWSRALGGKPPEAAVSPKKTSPSRRSHGEKK